MPNHRGAALKVAPVILLLVVWISAWKEPAHAAEEWGWFAAISAIDRWETSQGKASVEISGRRFSAKLLREDGGVAIVLSGTVENGQVTVTATEMDSDSPRRRLQGRLKTSKWVDGSGSRRSILLMESGVAGGLVIGLTKEMK